MIKQFLKISVCAIVFASTFAHAKDYGIQGSVWPIAEIDIRQLILESASRTDWTEVNQSAQDSGKRYLSSLPKRQFYEPEKTFIKYIDPSITITEDIKAPVKQNNGLITWEVLAAKGTRVNPLHTLKPATAFLLFDGSKPEQVTMLKEVLDLQPDRITPVEAGAGDVKELAADFKRPIFWASDAMLTRFEIEHLPSFVFVEQTGETQNYLSVAAFAQPFHAPSIIATWTSLGPTKPRSQLLELQEP